MSASKLFEMNELTSKRDACLVSRDSQSRSKYMYLKSWFINKNISHSQITVILYFSNVFFGELDKFMKGNIRIDLEFVFI